MAAGGFFSTGLSAGPGAGSAPQVGGLIASGRSRCWEIGPERWAGPVTDAGVWRAHHHKERLKAAEPGGDGCAVPAGDGVIRVRDREADEPSVRIAVKHPLGEATDQIRGKTRHSLARRDLLETPRTHQPEAMGTWGRCITSRKAIAEIGRAHV